MTGMHKRHQPDRRITFGVSDSAVFGTRKPDWEELGWIAEDYAALKAVVANLINDELAEVCGGETCRGTLGAKLRNAEAWSQSAMRHCLYPSGGSCTEHTDYGVVTWQHCTSSGLEAHIRGGWQRLQPPNDCAVLFAGDMLARLTNGKVPALVHRVCIEEENSCEKLPVRDRDPVRQAHILFLQPDRETIIQPLKPYLSGTGHDLQPIRYGDWHQKKVELAFGHCKPRDEVL